MSRQVHIMKYLKQVVNELTKAKAEIHFTGTQMLLLMQVSTYKI